MISYYLTNRKCKWFYDLYYPETASDKTLSKYYILENLKRFKMDVYQEEFHHIIIYYTGHGYKEGLQKGHWVCRDNEGISLKEISDLFK